jgi:hypothetical protein
MKDSQIKDILCSNVLSNIEATIAANCKTFVNTEYIDFTINVVRREILNSGLTLDQIREKLTQKEEDIIRFGTQLLNEIQDKPIEEEYPKSEDVHQSERPAIIASHGIGNGFGIKL